MFICLSVCLTGLLFVLPVSARENYLTVSRVNNCHHKNVIHRPMPVYVRHIPPRKHRNYFAPGVYQTKVIYHRDNYRHCDRNAALYFKLW